MPTDSSSLNRAYPTSTVSEAASGCDDERPRRKEQEIRTGNQGLIESSPVARKDNVFRGRPARAQISPSESVARASLLRVSAGPDSQGAGRRNDGMRLGLAVRRCLLLGLHCAARGRWMIPGPTARATAWPPAVTVPALSVRRVARRQQPAGLAHRWAGHREHFCKQSGIVLAPLATSMFRPLTLRAKVSKRHARICCSACVSRDIKHCRLAAMTPLRRCGGYAARRALRDVPRS
jgi:hypothetical protein